MRLGKAASAGIFVIISLLGFLPLQVKAQNSTDGNLQEKVLEVFYPYRQGAPQVDGITPGTTINQTNFQVAEKVLPPEILRVVEAGDLEITVQETTDFPLREEFVSASVEHFGQVQLGEDGELKNYTKGLPFPILEGTDRQVGLKAAWNFRLRDLGDTMQNQGVLHSINNSGGIERSVETRYARMYGMHRLNPDLNVPEWEKEGIWWKDWVITLRPQDLEGAQLLTVHPDIDSVAHEKWAYDPRSRRTRKVVHNVYENSMGLNFMVEDYSGFNGYIYVHTWNYQGEQIALVPGFLKGERPTTGGKNNWYPMVPWELRKVVIMEVTPKDSSHPYGKRRFYIDRQTFSVLYAFVYDHDGNHWRTLFHCFGNPQFDSENANTGVPLHIGNIWVDYHTNHASVWVSDKMLVNKPLPPKMFTVKELMRRGK
jgi:hypothetical protein